MKDLYKDVGSFMIRTPSLPINLLVDNMKGENKIDNAMLLSDSPYYKKQFDEAIFVASHDLYESMSYNKKEENAKDTNNLLNSIYKYFSRSCSRCTPFGLFSTVAFGDITLEKTAFELSETKLKRKPLVDSNWLFEVVLMYESRYLKSLRYTINESVAVDRNKACLLNCTQNSDGESVNKKSVNYSNAFEIVRSKSSDYVSYSEIIGELKKAYPDVEEGTFHTYVQSLIKEGYLISDLRPPLTIIDQLEYFICKLREYEIDTDVFVDIKKKIERYSAGDNGDKTESLTKLYQNMKAVKSSKNYLAIDSSFDYKECHLNKNEIRKINKLIHLFVQFNMNESFDILSGYKNKFLEKYGQSRCVPLIELVNPDIGIGFPSHYSGRPDVNGIRENINPWVRFFERKYIEAIRLNQEIEITDADITMLLSKEPNTDELPKSMEIYFNYIRENGKDVFLLSNIFGSTYAGKSFGRFSHFMKDPKQFYQKINRAYGSEEECQFCEFTFLPNKLYSANVIRNTHGSTYETSFGTSNSKENKCRLRLDEILVGFENNRFYLKSAIDNKRIIPTSTNMFNPQLKPQILRLIDDISCDGMKIYNKPWQQLLEKFAYLPTIRYKNFILEQEKWTLKIEDLGVAKHCEFEEFKSKLNECIKARNIPVWVNSVEADKKILLNLGDDRCLSVLQKLLEKSETVLERYDVEAEHPVKYKDNSYCCELVIPFILAEKGDAGKAGHLQIAGNCGGDRMKEPLDEWLYFKLYGVGENVEYLLGDALFTPLKELLKTGEIDSYFFIQYRDPDMHLRLRVKAEQAKLMAVQPKLLKLFRELRKQSLISKYCIDCYELELERYGGYDLMDDAHEVFHKDSVAVQSIISQKRSHSINISDDRLALLIIFYHTMKFKLSLEDMFVFLNCENKTKQYQKEFQQNKDSYIEFVLKDLAGERITPEVDAVLGILSVKDEVMENYLRKIEACYPNNKAVKFSILDSLLHMNMNRLFGPNVEFERKMRSLARHAYYNVYNRNKKTGILDGV